MERTGIPPDAQNDRFIRNGRSRPERIFLTAATLPHTLELSVGAQEVRLETTTARQRADALDRLNQAAWSLDADARQQLVRDVRAWSCADDAPRASHRVLTADEVRALARRPGHGIGAHTAHHLALTTQPVDTKRREVFENKAAIERVLQQPVHLFSYPYGDFDAELTGIVGDARFRAAVTVQPGLVSAGTNRLLLPRCEITAQHHHAFPQRMQEIFAGVTTDTAH